MDSLLSAVVGAHFTNSKLPKDVWFMECENARSDERCISLHCEPFYKGTTEIVCIYKNLHVRNGRQAGIRLFAQSISNWRTTEARFIYSPEPDDFL